MQGNTQAARADTIMTYDTDLNQAVVKMVSEGMKRDKKRSLRCPKGCYAAPKQDRLGIWFCSECHDQIKGDE